MPVMVETKVNERLEEAELESILRQAEEGRYVVETAEEHFRRLGI
jgi:hypothetical protein